MTHHADLEKSVDEALKALPSPRAPGNLLPRVLLAVQQAALRPWYTREWLSWPRGWQVASAAALLVLLAAVTSGLPLALETAQTSSLSREVVRPAGAAAQQLAAGVRAAELVWQVLLQPVVSAAALVFLLMASICVVVGVVISRVALGEVFQS